MTDMFIASPVIISAYDLQPNETYEEAFSPVSLENIIFGIVAFCVWTLETIMGIAFADQVKYIKDTKIHSTTWYSDYAKRFQLGMSLPWGLTEYDNTGLTDAQIEAMKVVKFASTTKIPGGLLVKIAGILNGGLAPIPAPEFTPFQEYMFRISAAGDNLSYRNVEPDHLRLQLKIFYNSLVLDSQGRRLDGTNDEPVQQAITSYIESIDFDARFVPAFLTDALQAVEGVRVPHLISAMSQHAALPYVEFPPEGDVPYSGYLRIYNPPTDLLIEWLPMSN